MAAQRCQSCSDITMLRLMPGDSDWQQEDINSAALHLDKPADWFQFCEPAQACIIFASANKIRKCSVCRYSLDHIFRIPKQWWTDYCKNMNGYFGTEEVADSSGVLGRNMWAFFEIKYVDPKGTSNPGAGKDYEWSKINVFSRWIPSTQQTTLLIFDAGDRNLGPLRESLTAPGAVHPSDPFWIFSSVASVLAECEDSSVWAVRDRIRSIEKQPPPQGKPEPDYRELHNIARHTTHVTETLDVATSTLKAIITQQDLFMKDSTEDKRRISKNINDHLLFCNQMLISLRHRSISNEKRLQNEIQLAFNTVAQYDSRVSVEISHAARVDSAAMRTVSFLTMVFLPPTFVSAIFSMSFFNYDRDLGWSVSDKFWLYWVVALPLTLIAVLVWKYWSKLFHIDVNTADGRHRWRRRRDNGGSDATQLYQIYGKSFPSQQQSA